MNSWLTLAFKEFTLPFRPRFLVFWKRENCPGGRDFMWLSLFMSLILTLLLLLFASYEGLLNRFVDVLLGHVPGHGIPVAVTANILQGDGIDSAVMAEVDRYEWMRIFPYRVIEGGYDPYVSLADDSLWKNRAPDDARVKIGPDFDGWAVYPDDPLWTPQPSKDSSPENQSGLPLQIVLNRRLFSEFFDYELYYELLQQELPAPLLESVPPPDELRHNNFKTFWLWLNLYGKKCR